jgi:hypothetical protein
MALAMALKFKADMMNTSNTGSLITDHAISSQWLHQEIKLVL